MTNANSSSVTRLFRQMAVTPSPTRAGVLGMVRIILALGRKSVLMPGATVMNTLSAILVRLEITCEYICGLMVRKMKSAKSAADWFSESESDALISSSATIPLLTMPFIIAFAILPWPMKLIFMVAPLFYGASLSLKHYRVKSYYLQCKIRL